MKKQVIEICWEGEPHDIGDEILPLLLSKFTDIVYAGEVAAQQSVQRTGQVCTCPEPLMLDGDWACRECGNPPRR